MAEERAELAQKLAGLETRLIPRLKVALEQSPESFLEEAKHWTLIRLKKELRG